MNLIDTFRKVIIANELDGDLSFVLKFSDPDGVRTGKSGYSFGVSQFDINNNPTASTCLRACGFTVMEIAQLRAQCVDVHLLEAKLRANAQIVEKFDDIQLKSCLTRAQSLLGKYGIKPAADSGILAVADYANQYYLSDVNKPGYLVGYLARLGRPFTPEDVLQFKLKETTYGKEHRKDCIRRYDNLVRIVAQA